MKRFWIVPLHLTLLSVSVVLAFGLAWLCTGIAASSLYVPPALGPADFPLHDTYFVIAREDFGATVLLLSFLIAADVIAAAILARFCGERLTWIRIGLVLLLSHVATGVAMLVRGPSSGFANIYAYLGSALGAVTVTLIALSASLVRTLSKREAKA